MRILGIDVGGTGIKAAPVDTATGERLAKRVRLDTPQPATPSAVAETVVAVQRAFEWTGPIGCAFPARIKDGVALTATNIDKAFLGLDVEALLADATGERVHVLNDADAAGVAEAEHGTAREAKGVVLMLTFGTGIGSALFVDGRLVPNTELGHVYLPNGRHAETYAADRAREEGHLSWATWAKRVQRYLDHMEFLFGPDLIVVGGGVSKKARWAEFGPLLTTKARLAPAALRNEAGIVGAAAFAALRER